MDHEKKLDMLPFQQFKHNSNQNKKVEDHKHNSNQDKKVEDHKNENKPQSKYKNLNELTHLIKTNLNISNLTQKSNVRNKSSEQGTSKKTHHKTNWNDLPIELQLKILNFLNQSYQIVIVPKKSKGKDSKKTTVTYFSTRDTILPRSHLSRLLYVNRAFADLIRVFVWHSVNLTIASVPQLKKIEECILKSDQIAANIKAITFKWYQPQYNNIWENWFESPIYESNLKIFKSLKNLISLELILNEDAPYYSNLPISNQIKSIGNENLSDLLRFRLVTCWLVGLDDEELMTNLLKNSTGLKRFECHCGEEGIKTANLRVDELSENSSISLAGNNTNERFNGAYSSRFSIQAAPISSRTSVIKEKRNQLEIRLPKLLSSFLSLEYLAISTEACLDEDWIKTDWSKTRIQKLVLSDFKSESFNVSLSFMKCLSHTVKEIAIDKKYGHIRKIQNDSSSIPEIPLHLPKLKTLTIRLKLPQYLETFIEHEFDYISIFSHSSNQIEELNLIKECSMKIEEDIILLGLHQSLQRISGNWKSLKLIKFAVKCPKKYSESTDHEDNQDEDQDDDDNNFSDRFKNEIVNVLQNLKLRGIHFEFLF
ncbi:uncharacterized protein MELLADRAFT_111570 [Melampsora larici-populina 98AG31]|uniref:Uncharacterized protein n=1 Tax=Melampsora larici-populina (strain 98AG31 / pathotype 3-4-7) TaxID=747676 RepID=F4S3M2_MELLP|nr:uncharacterized protein MELLADRAFT_111570 [Melampsora larici-populina 98AG31]EGG00697.1 hypothetical protein MELLADRAFT_111570 [Melampsora larici-populina 98AG31]